MDTAAIVAIVKLLLPALAPVIVMLLKKFGPSMIDAAPGWAKVLVSLIISLVLGYLTGDMNTAGAALTAAGIGALAIKGRDILKENKA